MNKKNWTITVITILFAFNAYSQNDFRNTSWGMTKEQVKKAENVKYTHEEDQLLISFGSAANIECFILYFFISDSLVETGYIFKAKHEKRNDYVTDYDLINGAIKSKYGKPSDERQIWKNDTLKVAKDLFGNAVNDGSLTCFTKWKTKNTEIVSILSGTKSFGKLPATYDIKDRNEIDQMLSADIKHNIFHVVYYSSTKHRYLKEKLEKEKSKGKSMEF